MPGRRLARQTVYYGYTVDEVARFLQYDHTAVRYWLRTGHLAGSWDPKLRDWRVTSAELVSFLRQSSMPLAALDLDEPELLLKQATEEFATIPRKPGLITISLDSQQEAPAISVLNHEIVAAGD